MSTTPYSPMVNEQARPVHPRNGSVGPVIGVLAVIAVLGVISVMIGRLCSGRKIMGHGHFNLETWVEMKCGSCIDGHLDTHHPAPPPPPPPQVVVQERSAATPTAADVEEHPQEETAAAVH